jgi:hypothetical protein
MVGLLYGWFFAPTEFGRAPEARALLEPLAPEGGIFTTLQNDEFVVAVDIEIGEEKDRVVRGIVDQLRWVARNLSTLR